MASIIPKIHMMPPFIPRYKPAPQRHELGEGHMMARYLQHKTLTSLKLDSRRPQANLQLNYRPRRHRRDPRMVMRRPLRL